MSKITVIGAGKTGRGFLGRLIAESGKEIYFIDKNEELVEELNNAKTFEVGFFGNTREPFAVSNYRASVWEDADLSDAELIFVSVGGTNLEDVGAKLNKRLKPDKKYYIITCENCSKPSERLKAAINTKNIAISEATVFCTTIEAKGLNISSENYPYLQCNADLLEGYTPDVAAVKPIESFGNFLTRKLYTYNAASCVIAYMGAFYGFTDYGAAANDARILKMLDENYSVTNEVLCKEFGYAADDQAEFAALSKKKFCDRTISDTVARNAREPQRKLGAGERIIGPMKLIYQNKTVPTVLIKTAAAALLYRDDNESEWNKICSESSAQEILKTVCGLSEGDFLYDEILKYYNNPDLMR